MLDDPSIPADTHPTRANTVRTSSYLGLRRWTKDEQLYQMRNIIGGTPPKSVRLYFGE